MVVYDVFEVLYFCQVHFEISPILFDYLVAEIIDEPFDEIQHLLCEKVRFLKTSNIRHLHTLQVKPYTIKLPLNKLTPEKIPKEHLIFPKIPRIDNQIQRKFTFEVKIEIIDVFGLFFYEGFFRREVFEFEDFYLVDLFVDGC